MRSLAEGVLASLINSAMNLSTGCPLCGANVHNVSGPFPLRQQICHSAIKRGYLSLVVSRQFDEIRVGNLAMTDQRAAGKAGQIIDLQVISPEHVAR